MRLSNSKAKTWRRCPKKYEFKYVEKLEPKQKGVALERGSWIHELLEKYYDGDDWKAHHKKLTNQFYSLFEEQREHLGDLPQEILRIMRAYFARYHYEDSDLTVVDSELDEIVTMPNGVDLNVIIDLIVEDSKGRLWAWDHKTRKNFSDSDSMLLDPQLTLYYWALQKMGYKPLAGVVYNEIRTKPPTIPERLKSGGLTQRMNIDTDVSTYMAEIKRHGLDPQDYTKILNHIAVKQKDSFFRRTMIPKDKPVLIQAMRELGWTADEITNATDTGHFPRTFIQGACSWDCEYKDLCITQLHGGDIEPMIKMNFQRRKKDG